MYAIWIILVICVLSVSAGPDVICPKVTEELGADFDKCDEKDPERVVKVIRACHKEVLPDKEPNKYNYFVAACKDPTLWKTFNKCFTRDLPVDQFPDSDFANSAACYEEMNKKYDIK
ncbi:uncharacterized protein [Parasteatoda tepidariorum]|uniref:uncharacterized protein isoform X1 n=1 Tax=Parasteatoda tepidariorum TaxID=114398 RepID=UPI001C71BC9F|nr:uncharacterized protein LOC107442345 isoform X1 [Parasteatoda tepidariorum]XP_042909042.1 uncharacterized protein LOC107442345 isoform X1 [Parasteatoda tepidariorum]